MGARQSQVLVWEKNVPSPQRIVSSFHGKECISIAVGGGHYAAVVSTGKYIHGESIEMDNLDIKQRMNQIYHVLYHLPLVSQ